MRSGAVLDNYLADDVHDLSVSEDFNLDIHVLSLRTVAHYLIPENFTSFHIIAVSMACGEFFEDAKHHESPT